MVIALDLASARPERMWSGVSPLAELMACLHVLAEPDHHPESRQWRDRVDATMSDGLRSDLFRFAPLWARYRMRLFFPTAAAQLGAEVEAEIRALERIDDRHFLPMTANAIRGRRLEWTSGEQVLDDRTWVRECEQRSFTRGDLAHSLVEDPDRFRQDLASTLHRCVDEFFRDEWDRTSVQLQRMSHTVAEAIPRNPPVDVVASLTAIASSRGSASTVFFDKLQSGTATLGAKGLILIPSMRAWPHVMVKLDQELPIVIQYLVQEDADGTARSQQELRRRLAALAEPGRWELCRHLIGEPITTSELAIRTGLSKSSVSRHLRALKDAGLISSQKDGRQVFHRLPPAVIVHLGHEVLRGMIR